MMKKTIKVLSCLCLALVLLLAAGSFSLASETPPEPISAELPITLGGIEYTADLPLVESRSQMNYQLTITGFDIQGSAVRLTGDIYKDGAKLLSIDSKGAIYNSGAPLSQKTGRSTLMFEKNEDYKIVNCNVQACADGGLLFPVNAGFDKEPVMEVAVFFQDKFLYFEDGLSDISLPEVLKEHSLDACDEDVAAAAPKSYVMSSDDDTSLAEDVQASDSWRSFLNQR